MLVNICLICCRAQTTLMERHTMLTSMSFRYRQLQQALQEDKDLIGLKYKADADRLAADAKRLERKFNESESARQRCLLLMAELRDKNDSLKVKLANYEDAERDLQNVIQLKTHLRTVTEQLGRSQETVAKYQAAQVCTLSN